MNDALFDLGGKVAIVTGTSRGLGQYFARALARAGADLIITSRTLDSLAPFEKEIKALGRRVVSLELDVTNQQSIEKMARDAEAAFGQIHILVNNAGCNRRKLALEVTWDDWNTVLDTNLRGSFFVAQAVARGMIGQWLRAHHQYRLSYVRCRICGLGALWCKPRRYSPNDHEPGRRLGQIRSNCQLPGAWLVQDRAEPSAVRRRGLGGVSLRNASRWGVPASPTIWMAPWFFSLLNQAAT